MSNYRICIAEFCVSTLSNWKEMGGGASVLTPEMSKKLTQPSLDMFHQLQAECEEQNMTPVEMYLFLTSKYEELLAAEQDAIKALSGESEIKKVSSTQKADPNEKIPLLQKVGELFLFTAIFNDHSH